MTQFLRSHLKVSQSFWVLLHDGRRQELCKQHASSQHSTEVPSSFALLNASLKCCRADPHCLKGHCLYCGACSQASHPNVFEQISSHSHHNLDSESSRVTAYSSSIMHEEQGSGRTILPVIRSQKQHLVHQDFGIGGWQHASR